MADAQNPSNTQTLPESTPVQLPTVPAPSLPVPGAATSAPLTGQGIHRQPTDAHDTPASLAQKAQQAGNAVQQPKRPPAAPPAQPPRRPPAQPPVITQSNGATPTPMMPPMPPPMANVYAGWQNNPAMLSMMMQTLNQQRPAAQKFHLMVLPEAGWPTFEEYDDVTQLVARIKAMIGQPYCLFAFLGFRLPITNGPLRYLQTPMGALPLFDIPNADAAPTAEFGWVGPDMDIPVAPTSDTEEVAYEEELPSVSPSDAQQVQPLTMQPEQAPGSAGATTPTSGNTPMF